MYCEVYGNTIQNRIIEYFLENSWGVCVGDMARDVGVSRPKAYEVVYSFLDKGYVLKDRVVGKTQLYTLNKEHPHVKIFLRNFRECLQMVVDEYKPKKVEIKVK